MHLKLELLQMVSKCPIWLDRILLTVLATMHSELS